MRELVKRVKQVCVSIVLLKVKKFSKGIEEEG